MTETFHPRERIRRKKDFQLLYRKGKRFKGKYFHLIYFPNDLSFSRMAVVVSRKVGKAVIRNKIKRWTRELYRKNKNLLKENIDMLIVFRKSINEIKRPLLQESYLEAIQSLWEQK